MSYRLNRMLDPLFWWLSHSRFESGLARVRSVEDAIELAWTYSGYGLYRRLKPNQDRGEVTSLVRRVASISPRVIVEIGTRGGGTLFFWSQSSAALELLVSIDLPGGIHGGGYPEQSIKFYKRFVSNRPNCRLELMRTDSQVAATRASLEKLLAGRPIDFLFIDGDHRYEGVKKDFALYRPLVRPGGLIAFHDIRPNIQDAKTEVYRLWDEIKASGESIEEFVHEPYRGYFGIGVMTQPGAPAEAHAGGGR